MTITFGSVCSGIEAASVAWGPLGWKADWFSEIKTFPSLLLSHRYPSTPNLGDMSLLPSRILSGEITAPDILCGGTPCQAFSVAGLRESFNDSRGSLSLTFCEIANAIDSVRSIFNAPPSVVFWENVVGVLSTHDNAFGCFLAGLAGENTPLLPAERKWGNAGYVLGPKRAVAWRVLDAQYFGVAKRRRVFVVASNRDGFDPAEILFDRKTTTDVPQRSVLAPGMRISVTARNAGNANARGLVLFDGKNFRSLTPIEEERRLGIPDNYTLIPGGSDAGRYEALGNSWAVPVVRWLGERMFWLGGLQ